ncbi:MAG: hypothetical protein K6A34_07285 [Methanobrevibacter sp.]|nr:hypothetical protein [Methanobrevibacter sp.]
MNSFVDTNVSIGFMFSIDPLNNKAISVFNEYGDIFWSNCVKKECKKVFNDKRIILTKFFKDLSNNLTRDDFHDFKFEDLKDYVLMNYNPNKSREKILSSLNKFWDNYVGDRFPTYESFINSITQCLFDLRVSIYRRRTEWESVVLLTEERTKKYYDLKNKLNSIGVHSPDDIIVLDAHDHNLRNDYDLDFITFDSDCCEAASNIEGFCFNKVKGIYDYF